MFAHLRKPGEIIVKLRQEIEAAAQIHSKYWPSLSAVPSDRRQYHFSAKSPLFFRTRPGLALLNYLPCSANTISCINHSNDPVDCQVQDNVFLSALPRTRICKSSPLCVGLLLTCFHCVHLALNPLLAPILSSIPP